MELIITLQFRQDNIENRDIDIVVLTLLFSLFFNKGVIIFKN